MFIEDAYLPPCFFIYTVLQFKSRMFYYIANVLAILLSCFSLIYLMSKQINTLVSVYICDEYQTWTQQTLWAKPTPVLCGPLYKLKVNYNWLLYQLDHKMLFMSISLSRTTINSTRMYVNYKEIHSFQWIMSAAITKQRRYAIFFSFAQPCTLTIMEFVNIAKKGAPFPSWGPTHSACSAYRMGQPSL